MGAAVAGPVEGIFCGGRKRAVISQDGSLVARGSGKSTIAGDARAELQRDGVEFEELDRDGIVARYPQIMWTELRGGFLS